MEEKEFLRIVSLRGGKLKPVEFKIRQGEKGLSLFAHTIRPSAAEVIEAVRASGKQGILRAAVLQARDMYALGLRLVQTKGGTLQAEINAIHYELRLPFLRRLFFRIQGIRPHEYFNEHLSQKLCTIARLLN
jgi:hypothetical protein